MRNLVCILLIAAIFISCDNATDSKSNTSDSVISKSPNSVENDNQAAKPASKGQVIGCYMRVLQRDTMVAQLFQTGNTVSGKLTFDNYEKDSNIGTVSGTVENDVLSLIYTFQSEGTTSKREIRFKRTDDGIILGNGEMQEKAGVVVFSSPTSINYPSSEKLTKVECNEVPAKYKQ